MPRRSTALELFKRRLGARVSAALKRRRMTVERLALKSGLPYEFVKRVADGKFYPGYKARAMMAKALGTTTRYLES